MILTGHQPQFLGGYCGYIEKIASADVYIYMDEVEFSKNDFVNRNRIKTNQGEKWLTVPILYQGHAKIKDIQIDTSKRWQKKHLESIRQAYSKTPFYKQYEPFLSDLYTRPWDLLADLNLHILEWILDELGVTTKIIKMSDRNFQGTKSDLILDMCLQLQADYFIFGAQGRDYAKPVDFHRAGISIEFQEFIHPEYVQPHGNFLPYMAVLDIMFQKGKNSLDVIRGTK